VIPNPNMETPHYEIRRIRRADRDEFEDATPSYELASNTNEEDVAEILTDITPPARPQAVVRDVEPTSPAPTRTPKLEQAPAETISNEAQPSFVRRLWGALFGDSTPKQASTEETENKDEKSQGSRNNRSRRSSNNRGNNQRNDNRRSDNRRRNTPRDGDKRGNANARSGQSDKPAAIEKPNSDVAVQGKATQPRNETAQAPAAAVTDSNKDASQENAPRSRGRRRGGRGRGRNRNSNTNATATSNEQAGENTQANSTPTQREPSANSSETSKPATEARGGSHNNAAAESSAERPAAKPAEKPASQEPTAERPAA
jgi:ribonuclease E